MATDSAERAVEGDLVQGTLENCELLIVEALDEELRDPRAVDRHGLAEPCDAGVGQRDHDATGIGVGAGTPDEALRRPTGRRVASCPIVS